MGASGETVLFTGTVNDILLKNGAVPEDVARLVFSDDTDDRSAIPTKPSSVTYEVKAETFERADNGTDPRETADDGTVSTSESGVTTYSIPLATGYKWKITVNMKATVNGSSVDVLSDSFTMETPLSAGSVLSHNFYLAPIDSTNGGFIELYFSPEGSGDDAVYDLIEIASVMKGGEDASSSWDDQHIQLTNSRLTTKSGMTIPSGVYDVTFIFRKDGRFVYSTTQTMTILPNLITNKWVSAYVVDQAFYVTSEMVQAFAQTQLFVGTSSYGEAAAGNPGTPYEPFLELSEALIYIKNNGDNTKDYTIHISGEHNGNFEIGSDFDSKIKSLTLCGIPDTTDDILNGDNADDSVLTIATTKPVTIKNLKITNGNASNGGGINIASGATVTLANGAVVAGNRASTNGGGVYNAGTLFMYGSAVIGHAGANTEASSESNYSNCARYGGGLYNAVGAKAYLGYSATNTPLELTGGICFNYSGGEAGAVYNKDVLKMNSGRISYNGCAGFTGGVTSDGSSSNFELSGGAISYNKTYAPNNSQFYAGGVRISSSGSQFTMTGGEISWNESNIGGGVSFIGGVVTFKGGVIKNNKAQKGSGIFLESGTLNISGSAVVASGNDIWLDSSQHITITSALEPPESAGGKVATITPASPAENLAVLVKGADVSDADFAAACSKIAVTGASYYVGSDGKLKSGIMTTGANAATAISGITAEGTTKVIVYGEIGEDYAIRDAIGALSENVFVSLDLSLATGLTELPYGAFNECANLTSVILPDSVTSMGKHAFYGCKKLEEIDIPNGITAISDYAFYNCENLTSVNLPNGVTSIGQNAFDGCKKLTSINFPEGLKTIGYEAFNAAGMTSVIIPNSVTSIGGCAFRQCPNLESIVLSNKLTELPNQAIQGCPKLKSITIPSSVTSIGERVFYCCNSLKIVTFECPSSSSRMTIGSYAFAGDPQLNAYPVTTVNFLGTEEQRTAKLPENLSNTGLSNVTWCYFVPVAGTTITGAVTGSSVFIDGRTVTIDSLYVSDHEVTQAEYQAIMGSNSNPSHFTSSAADGETQENRPVEKVSWYDALVYCNKRSIAEGLTPCYTINGSTNPDDWGAVNDTWNAATCNFSANGYRLPTEAEWEYAARGGSDWKNYTYSGSDTITDVAWYNGYSDNKTHEVKKKTPNALGIYDMSGNVWEWCWDWYGNITSSTAAAGASSGSNRILRGGSWYDNASSCAVSYRGNYDPCVQGDNDCFRVVRTASEIPGTVTCTVTFDSNEGTAVANQNVVSGTCAVVPTAPTNALLNFGGWYTTATPSGSDKPFNFTTPITGNITLYAKWNSDFVFVGGTYFDGSATVSAGTSYASQVFTAGRELAIQNMYVCDHEVTQKEYETYCKYGDTARQPDDSKGKGENYPAYYINWYDAIVYCNLRSMSEEGIDPVYSIGGETDPSKWTGIQSSSGKYCGPSSNNDTWNTVKADTTKNGYRLPTEVEWEYLARGGNLDNSKQTRYSGSETINDVAWYSNNSAVTGNVKQVHEVKTMTANGKGIYDMSGNVWELCWDSKTKDGVDKRAVRGGSVGCSWDADGGCYVSYQTYDAPEGADNNQRKNDVGFRVVRSNLSETNHNVTYNTDGGTEIASQNVWNGYYLPKPATPSKAMHKFGGWYSDASLSTLFDFSTPITGNTTLYAKWNSDFVFVEGTHFNGSATVGSGGSAASQVFIEGRSLIIPDLYVSDHEVTQGEFVAVMKKNPSTQDYAASGEIQENRPVDKINWYDAIAYCNKLSAMEGLTPCYTISGITDEQWANLTYDNIPTSNDGIWNAAVCDFNADGYRLPTEAEWEYIARGGNGLTGTQYAYSGTNGGSDLTNYAWYSGNAEGKTHEVKKKAPNNLGIYDMSGNVYEWCWDYYGDIDSNTPASGPDTGIKRVLRDGDFSIESDFKVNRRSQPAIHSRLTGRGFRVVRTNKIPEQLAEGTTGTAGTGATYMYFGEWPQTIIASGVEVDERISKENGLFTYYYGSDGAWYVKQAENAYGTNYTYSNGTSVAQGGTSYKYFKVEPIKWRVLTTNYNGTGKKLLLSENILANMIFYDSTYDHGDSVDVSVHANNYEHSRIRAYLNGINYDKNYNCADFYGKGFLQTAFTSSAQSQIANTTVMEGDNAIMNNKVFLLSTEEAKASIYGLNEAASRIRATTDFAKASGTYIQWWVRSSGSANGQAQYINTDGGTGRQQTVHNTGVGVVPAICIE